MSWRLLTTLSVVSAGVLAFLRVVSNEIYAIERQLRLLEAEERKRLADEQKWNQAA